jgi:hypothetical protein
MCVVQKRQETSAQGDIHALCWHPHYHQVSIFRTSVHSLEPAVASFVRFVRLLYGTCGPTCGRWLPVMPSYRSDYGFAFLLKLFK